MKDQNTKTLKDWLMVKGLKDNFKIILHIDLYLEEFIIHFLKGNYNLYFIALNFILCNHVLQIFFISVIPKQTWNFTI